MSLSHILASTNESADDDEAWSQIPKECGLSRASNRIVGGEEAFLGQFPWMARLFVRVGSRKTYICGGSIISKKYVVTAAHCFDVGVRRYVI